MKPATHKKSLDLLLDVGNSRSKWRLVASDGSIESCGSDSGELQNLPQAILAATASLKQAATLVGRVRVAIVRSTAARDALLNAIQAAFNCPVEFAHTQASSLGITNSYAVPASMGVDRWCALLAAAYEAGIPGAGEAICVVDAGSAMTIDWVAGVGMHLGGYITPGYQMQVRELLRGTGQVFAGEFAANAQMVLGHSTQEAVHNGILASMVAHIEASIARQVSPGQGEPTLFLTGGDAETLAALLDYPATIKPGLVLDGLARLLP